MTPSSSDSELWAEELQKMVSYNRDTQNKAEMDKIMLKIEEICTNTHAYRNDIENMKIVLEDKQEERMYLVQETENIRESNNALAEEIKKMEAIIREKNQAAEQSTAAVRPDTITRRLSWWSSEAECQTSMVMEEETKPESPKSPSVSKAQRKSLRAASIKKPSSRAGAELSTTNSSMTADPSTTTTTSSPTAATRSTSKPTAPSQSRRASKKRGSLHPGHPLSEKMAGLIESSGLSQENIFKAEVMESYLDKRRSRFKERLGMTSTLEMSDDKDAETLGAADVESMELSSRDNIYLNYNYREDSMELAPQQLLSMYSLQEDDVQIPALSMNASTETAASLKSLLVKFVTNSIDHIKELLSELLAMRQNAREEIEKIKAKGEYLEEMECTMRTLEQMIFEQTLNLPNLSSSGNTVAIVNRHPPSHQCHLCICHKNTAETILLTTQTVTAGVAHVSISEQDDQKAVEQTRRQCQCYLKPLDKLKSVYAEVNKMIADSRKGMEEILSELVWGELGTSGYSDLDTDHDIEFAELVDDMLEIPTETEELMDRAGMLVFGIELLNKCIMATLDHSNIRLADVKWQNNSLDKLERNLCKARCMMETTALEIARARAQENFLETNKLLHACICTYCSCYNSTFEDGTRTRMGQKGGQLKNDIIHCLSSVHQMIKMVVTTVDVQYHPLVSAVHPEVLALMETAREKLFNALDICFEENGEEENSSSSSGHAHDRGKNMG